MKSSRLGQNFLVNPGVADRIVSRTPPGVGPLLEIGPGQGVLTRRILECFPHRPLTVVEKDPRLAMEVEERWGDRVRVIRQDVLTCRVEELVPKEKAFLVGNIPYLISTPLLEWVLFAHATWCGAVLMTQDEFARRIMEGSGPLAMAMRAFFTLTPVMRVSPGSFRPAPRIFSRVFTLAPREPEVDPRAYHAFLRLCFTHRRRSLRNNLRDTFPGDALDAALEKAEIPENARAEALPDAPLLALYSHLANDAHKDNS